MRITSDGVAAAGVATKRVFDEDGAAVDVISPLQAFAKETGVPTVSASSAGDAASLPAASEAYVKRIKARLEAVDGEDKARDRERVREKHLKRRLKDKDTEEEDLAEAPTLGSGSSSHGDADSDSESNGGFDASEDDGEGSESSEDGDDGGVGSDSSDGEEMPEQRAPKAHGKGSRASKGTTERSLQEQEDEVLAVLAARQRK
ncbi:unnamed protein product [Ectocarpus sp. 8 AP-2014]